MILYILFFLDICIGINRNNPIVRIIKDSNFKLVNENIIKNKNKIGIPKYKSNISIYFPNVLFKLFTVI